jgi:hypothetical protein
VAGAGIDCHGDLADALILEHADEHGEHDDRQIIHAVVACIFEEMQGH